MSTFHRKLRTFAECKREAERDAARRYFAAHDAPAHFRTSERGVLLREKRLWLARKERARHKRIVTRFGVRWAARLRYWCVHILPEHLDNHRPDVLSSAD